MSMKNLLLGGLVLLLSYADAAPSLSPRSSLPLIKRSNTLLGCNPDQTTKIGQALADMASLADLAFDGASTSSLGFSHYFQDSELTVFQTAMSTIAGNNDPTNPSFQFIVNCDPTGDVLAECGDSSYAITDATVPTDDNDIKSMWICPLFWTGPDSAQNLPGSDQAATDAFCGQTNYQQFVTAGHILLHEITHLDAVAKLFPLDPDPTTGEHGTLDYSIGSSPIQDARRLKIRIDNGQTDLQAPSYTAESYAGAATELWAQNICNLAFIPPQTGY